MVFDGGKNITGSIPDLPKGLRIGSWIFGDCSGLTGNIPELPAGLTYTKHRFPDSERDPDVQ